MLQEHTLMILCTYMTATTTTTTTITQCEKHSGEHLPVHTRSCSPPMLLMPVGLCALFPSQPCPYGKHGVLGPGKSISPSLQCTPQASTPAAQHWPRLILKSVSELRPLICVWHWPGSLFSLDCYLLLISSTLLLFLCSNL